MDNKFIMFENRLTKMFRHLSKVARKQKVSCFRVYDRDIPEFALCIEVYGARAYVAEYQRRWEMADDAHRLWVDRLLEVVSRVLEIPVQDIYFRQRKKKKGRQDQYQRMANRDELFVVEEGGLKFKVNLSDYLDTGLFLDHRLTRSMVRDLASGRNVLNLFCYTGSFSVYAAAGSARSITSVDLSNTYLAWAKENMILNGLLDDQAHHFVHADVLQFARSISRNAFDLIVLDPPTFSNSKRMSDFFDVQRDHLDLINHLLSVMVQGGIMIFSSNFSEFSLARDQIQAREVRDITRATTPFDFERRFSHWCYYIEK